MERRILSDVDGVILEWNEGFDKFMLEHGFHRVPGTDGEYNLAIRFGEEPAVINRMTKQWCESEHIEFLEALADSQKYISILSKHGFRFTAITSISDKPSASIARRKNLKMLFGDVFDDVICLKTGSCKRIALSEWEGSGLFWIEDHFLNAEVGYELGLKPILVNTPYNEHFRTDLFPRVSEHTPWKEITEMVFKEYKILK